MTDPAPPPEKKRPARLLWLGGISLVLLLAAYLAGFAAFVAYQPATPMDLNRIDGVVALTGGELRVDTAYRLFERGIGNRLLISGVYPGTSREKLMDILSASSQETPVPPDTRHQSPATTGKAINARALETRALEKRLRAIDIGYAAENTQGNAREAAAWARFYHFNTLLIVTARYHMPRSLSEFHEALPGVTLIPYPIDPDSIPKGWWRRGMANWRAIRLLHGEYAKYLAASLLAHLGLEATDNETNKTVQ